MFEVPESGRNLRILLAALVVVFGAQSIRFLFGSISWYLRDTVGLGVPSLIPIALAPFALAFLIPTLSRWLSLRGALWGGMLLLVLARSLNQISTDPAVGLWTSALATMAFVGLLPLLLSTGRSTLVAGVLLGIALDTAIRGMGLSLDVGYQTGLAPLVVVVASSLAALYLLWVSPTMERQGVTWGSGGLLVGIGPFLFIQFLILQNQGWTSQAAGIGGPEAQLRIALLNVVALFVVARLERSKAMMLPALAVVVATTVVAEGATLAFNLLSLVAVPAAALVWASMVPDTEERGPEASSVYLILGMVLFVALGLAYYVPLDLDVGFTQSQARLGVAVVLALFGLGGILSRPTTRPSATSQVWAFAALATVLPLFGFFAARGAIEPSDADDWPVRVMTYNIHVGYDTAGNFDIDSIAQVIEDSGASVVGLQELSRGWLIGGMADKLVLLQERLGFEHVAFFGTADPTWGNAVLSRFPITSVERVSLPLEGTLIRRGYLGVTLEIGDDEVLFISTHLQHVNDPSVHDEDPESDLYPVHHSQIGVIIREWGGRQPAILVGDFNARPGWRQLTELLEAGWVDAWEVAGIGDGFTSPANDPSYRIDYVFYTPDLVALTAGIIDSQASDHLPVIAELEKPNS